MSIDTRSTIRLTTPMSRPPAATPNAAAAASATSASADVQPAKPPHHGIHLPTPSGVKQGLEKGFVKSLDIRIPTVTRSISDAKREKILQSIQPGDIILETDNSYPGWQRLEFLTMRSNYTHAAMYEGDGKFIEATTPGGTQRTDLREYLHGPLLISVVRPAYKTPQDREAAIEFCRQQLGKPYNTSFNMDDPKSLYCAELVYKALQAMPNKIDVPLIDFQGRRVVAPDAFKQIEGAAMVYDDRANFWKSQLSTWPVMATAAAGAVAGAHFGAATAFIGFLAGLSGAICVGNKLQTGQFGFYE